MNILKPTGPLAKLLENPWIGALAVTTSVVVAVASAIAALGAIVDLPQARLRLDTALFLIVITYLVTLVVLLLLGERKSVSADAASGPAPSVRIGGAYTKTFNYDGRGRLWHGNEDAIAFRVITYHAFLNSLSDELGEADLQRVFFEAGKKAGADFGRQFGSQIYPRELQAHIEGKPHFEELTWAKRLDQWAVYDTNTGWGLLSVAHRGNALVINADHPTLLKDRGGQAFANFLAGYGLTVINCLMEDQMITLRFDKITRTSARSFDLEYSRS